MTSFISLYFIRFENTWGMMWSAQNIIPTRYLLNACITTNSLHQFPFVSNRYFLYVAMHSCSFVSKLYTFWYKANRILSQNIAYQVFLCIKPDTGSGNVHSLRLNECLYCHTYTHSHRETTQKTYCVYRNRTGFSPKYCVIFMWNVNRNIFCNVDVVPTQHFVGILVWWFMW